MIQHCTLSCVMLFKSYETISGLFKELNENKYECFCDKSYALENRFHIRAFNRHASGLGININTKWAKGGIAQLNN